MHSNEVTSTSQYHGEPKIQENTLLVAPVRMTQNQELEEVEGIIIIISPITALK